MFLVLLFLLAALSFFFVQGFIPYFIFTFMLTSKKLVILWFYRCMLKTVHYTSTQTTDE